MIENGEWLVVDTEGRAVGRVDGDEYIRQGAELLYRIDGKEIYRTGPGAKLVALIEGQTATVPATGAVLFRFLRN